jgi:hypothetical protein
MMAHLVEDAPAATPASQDEATRRSRIATRGKGKDVTCGTGSQSRRLVIETAIRL